MRQKYDKYIRRLSGSYDTIIVFIAAVVIYIVAYNLDLYELFHNFTRKYDQYELDEVFVVLIILSFLIAFISFRRSKELKKEVARRIEAEKFGNQSEEQYKELFESAHDAIIIFRPEDEVVLNVNERACSIYGYSRSEFIGLSLISISVNRPKGTSHIQNTLVEGYYHHFETVQRKKDGSEMQLEINASVIKYDGRDAILSINRDVTERKEIERAYKESEEKFKALVNNLSDVIVILDDKICYSYISPSFENITGYSVEEKLGKKLFDDIHPEDYERLLYEIGKGLKKDSKRSPLIESRFKKKNGEYIFIESIGLSLVDNPVIPGIMINSRDITQRKKTEVDLLLYSHAIRNISDGIIITDLDNNMLFVNQAFSEIYGYSLDEVVNRHISLLTYHENELTESVRVETVKKGWTGELLNKKSDGSIFPIELTTSTIYNDQEQVIGLVGIVKDISERKLAEHRLKESEKKYRLLAENSTDLIYIYSLVPGPHYEYISPSCEAMTGYTPEEGYADPFLYHKKFVTNEELEKFNEYLFAPDSEDRAIKERWRKKDGTYLWVEQVVSRNFDEEGNLISFQSTVRDITENQIAETALKESESRFRSLYENATLGLFQSNPEGKILLANPAFIGILGYDTLREVESLNLDSNEVYVTLSKRNEFKRILEAEDVITGFEVEWLRKDKSVIYVRLNGRAVRNDENEIVYYESTIEDITESKKAEYALQKSELLLDTTQSLSKVGGWEVDLKTHTITWTRETYRIHDIDPSNKITSLKQYLKLSLICYSPENRMKLGVVFRRCLSKGLPFDIELPFTSVKGEKLWIRATSQSQKEGKKVVRLIGNMMDITRQKAAEENLRDSERRYRSLYENATIGIYRTVPGGDIVFANPAFVNLLGYNSIEEMKLKNINYYSIYSDENRRKEFMQMVDEKNVVTGFEAKWITKNGTSIYIIINARVYKDAQGEVIHYDGTIENITERKQAEEALKISEEQYRSFFEKDISGNYLTTIDGEMLSCNSAFVNMLGYDSIEEIMNTHTSKLYPNTNNRNQFLESLRKNKVLVQSKIDLVRKDGKIIHCVENVIGIFDKDNELIQIQGYMVDITEQKLAEEKLRNSELKYRTVADWTYDWEYWIGPDEKIVYMSPSVKKITGYTVEEFVAKPILIHEIILQDDLEKTNKLKREFDKTESERTPFSAEFRILTKDSEIKWIGHWGRKIFSSSGEFLGIRASNKDITESKKSIEVISRLSAAIEQSPLSILITDAEGIIEYINPEGTKASGFSSEELIGRTPRVFKSGLTDQSIYQDLWGTIKSGNTWSGELLNKRKNGEMYWENIVISPIYNTSGNLSNFVAVREDVTEKIKNEKELEDYRERLEELVEARTTELSQSEEKFRVLAENSEDVIMRFDRDFRHLYVSPSVERFSGFKPAEVLGKTIDDLELPPPIKKSWLQALEQVFKTKEKIRLELHLPNGSWTDWIIVPEFNQQNEVDRVLSFARDITSLKESENKIQRALEKEKELNDFKSKFISTASHQFRTPLASILSSSQMIKRYSKKWDENKINEHHSRIGDSIKNLTQIMDDLLTISKTEEGRYNLKLEDVDLEECINKLIGEVDGVTENDKRIKFVNQFEKILFKTDKKLFFEIVNNLLTNAVKYSPPDKEILVKTKSANNKYLELSIKDHGIGIAEEDKKFIFDSFYRAKNGLDIPGTGLGLNIVKRGVELMKGNVTLESELGKGTKITVKLPLKV